MPSHEACSTVVQLAVFIMLKNNKKNEKDTYRIWLFLKVCCFFKKCEMWNCSYIKMLCIYTMYKNNISFYFVLKLHNCYYISIPWEYIISLPSAVTTKNWRPTLLKLDNIGYKARLWTRQVLEIILLHLEWWKTKARASLATLTHR